MSNVIQVDFNSTIEIDPLKTLNKAIEDKPKNVFVISQTEDGGFQFYTSIGNLGTCFYFVEAARQYLIKEYPIIEMNS